MKVDVEDQKETLEDLNRKSRDFDNAVYDLELLGEWEQPDGTEQRFVLTDEDQVKMWNKHLDTIITNHKEMGMLIKMLKPVEVSDAKAKPRKESKKVSK